MSAKVINHSRIKAVAAIMAHPDDEVLGCGGTLKNLSRHGVSVHVLILASGLTSRGVKNKVALESLKENARIASKKLGVKTIEFADFPDNAMDSVQLLDIVKRVEEFVLKVEPDIIFTHHNGDINIDHEITQRAVMTSTRALPGSRPIEILACEVLSSSEFGPAARRLQPHMYIRLEDEDVAACLDALSSYTGEIRDWPHPRSQKALQHQISLRGAECGFEAAEAFEVLRIVR